MKQKERDHARSLFVDAEDVPTELARSMGAAQANGAANGNGQAPRSRTFEPGGAQLEGAKVGKGLTDEQKQRVRKAIEKAGTLEEIQRLKRMLQDGFLPDEKTAKALMG